MKIKRKTTERSLVAGIGIGLIISILVTTGGVALVTNLALTERVGEQSVGVWAKVVLFVAVLTGTWVAAAATKQKRLQVCFLTGGIYSLLLLSTTAMFFGGRYQAVGITLIVVLAASAFVAFLPVKFKHNLKRRKRVFG